MQLDATRAVAASNTRPMVRTLRPALMYRFGSQFTWTESADRYTTITFRIDSAQLELSSMCHACRDGPGTCARSLDTFSKGPADTRPAVVTIKRGQSS